MAYRQTVRSEEVRAASRKKLLAAAGYLFAHHGYDATTMQQIVERADTSIGNAYFYFRNKDQLFTELVEVRTHAVWDRTEAAVASVPAGPARIAAIIYSNVASMLGSERKLARLVLTPGMQAMQVTQDITLERWRRHFAEAFPGMSLQEREWSAAMIWGANRTLTERVFHAEDDAIDPHAAARFAVRWALRALRVSERDITSALRVAARLARSTE